MSERSSLSSYDDFIPSASDTDEDVEKELFTNSHSKQVLNMMNTLRKNGMLCDVTLIVEGKEYPAHRIVLAACSDYFCAMFTNEMSEKHQTRVELRGIPCSVMQVLLDFVYTETVRVSVENVQELLPAACLLQLVGVKQACAEFLQRQLEPSNCLGIRAFAERHSCSTLQQAAAEHAYRHFESVVQGEEFVALSLQEVENLLGCNELQVESEEVVFRACLRWVKHNLDVRERQLPSVLRHVRMPLLSARCITDIVDSEDLVRKSLECRDLVDEAKRFHLRPDLRCNMQTVRTQPRIGCTDILVVLGGFGSQQNPVDSVERYDPRSCEWSKLPPIPKRRRYVSAAAMGSCLYVIGGYDGHTRLSTVEMIDLSKPKPNWRPVSPMHQRRGLAGVCTSSAGSSSKELLYVCGGFDGSVRHTTMEGYDPQIDQWTLLCAMQTGREGAGLVPAHSSLYCVGGYDGTTLLNSVERYDLHTSQWGSIPPMATKRSGAGVAVLNDVIYVCGGFDGHLHLSSVECYHILSGQWSMAANLSIPRCYVGAVVLRGSIYVIAGYDGTCLLDNIEVYDNKKDCWCILNKGMTAQRCDAGVAVVHLK